MYMPGTQDFSEKILSNELPGLTTIVLCFEDACPEELVEDAENNVYHLLDKVSSAVDEGVISEDIVPLIFVRVRNLTQFKRFSAKLTKHQVKSLCGINFPKFNTGNGHEYFACLKDLNEKIGEILYGMPIIEDPVSHTKSREYRN